MEMGGVQRPKDKTKSEREENIWMRWKEGKDRRMETCRKTDEAEKEKEKKEKSRKEE